MYMAKGQGQTAPRGQNFDVNRKALLLYPFVASFKEISLKSDFIHFFSWFYTCIQSRGRDRQPPEDKVLMSTEMSCHFFHLLQVSKKCLWSLILYNFFHDLIHVYSPRAGVHTASRGQSFDVNRNFLSLRSSVASFKSQTTIVSEKSRGRGTDPRGQNFDVNRKALLLYPFVAGFKEIFLKSDFIHFFSWFNTCI